MYSCCERRGFGPLGAIAAVAAASIYLAGTAKALCQDLGPGSCSSPASAQLLLPNPSPPSWSTPPPEDQVVMTVPQSAKPVALVALLAAAASAAAQGTGTPFVCDGSSAEPYHATKEYQGCYLDPGVNILREAKLSTIAMTPQYCANWCGGQGFAYGGVNFGTQCFCGGTPDFSRATKADESRCSTKCATEPSSACGATYVMSLYKVTNPQGDAGDGTNSTPNPPACQTNPLCSHPVCDTSKSTAERVASLVDSFTQEEKILNLIDASAGSERLGLPSHEWWNEATHGVGSAPGVVFPKPPRDFNHATSFPSPILTAASFDGPLMRAIGDVVGIEGRAFGNNGFSGFNFWAPNMNPFREPRWGRGQETPGEDVLLVKTYTQNYVSGMQGDDPEDKLIIANCKHYAAYDLETGRHANNYNPTQQDLADYYLAAFKTCVRDAHVGSIMCSYNSVGGIPTCSSPYLLQEVLRDHWNFTADYDFVVSDCGAVTDIVQYHNFTDTEQGAAAVALNAGTDLECGNSYLKLNESLADGETTVARVDEALTRLYTALFSLGYFDGGKHSTLGWSNVSTEHATELAYTAAVEGMTLLQNDGLLPLRSAEYKSVAVIGPYANATTEMQGDYSGKAPFLHSPLYAFQQQEGWTVNYAKGTPISAQNTTGFAEALEAAKKSDIVVFCGGIDNSLENETNDRKNISWPANQLELIAKLAELSKPLIVAQFGGGQVDGTPIVENENVNALLWAGYPSQDGGTALLDLLVGKQSFAGRLPITQYPAQYAEDVSMFDINLRPNGSFPGRTYMWYTGKPVFPFGHGLSYTKFDFEWKTALEEEYDIGGLVEAAKAGSADGSDGGINDITPFATVVVDVQNVGDHKSDYVGLLFLSSPNAGPEPRPNKVLASFARAHGIDVNCGAELPLALTLGSLARADEKGDLTIFPGDYKLALDNDASLTWEFRLTGEATVIETLPMPKDNYDFAVPVHIQPPSTERMGPD